MHRMEQILTPESRLRLARSIYGFYGADGCALRDAVDVQRTQPRLLRLVEALQQPAPADADQGETDDATII
jgi:hypothetical protein